MAASTSPSRAGLRRAQKVSGSPLPYLQAVAVGEAGAEGAAVGEGDAAATVADGAGAGADGVDPPEQDKAVATRAASEAVRTLRNFIPVPSRAAPRRLCRRAAGTTKRVAYRARGRAARPRARGRRTPRPRCGD